MALFFFNNNKRTRRFEHKSIYWNPEREALEERVARIRKELEESGDIDPDKKVELYNSETLLGKQLIEHQDRAKSDEQHVQFSEEFRASMLQNMSHLNQQEQKGISGSSRINEVLKILVMLLVLGVVVWYLYYR